MGPVAEIASMAAIYAAYRLVILALPGGLAVTGLGLLVTRRRPAASAPPPAGRTEPARVMAD